MFRRSARTSANPRLGAAVVLSTIAVLTAVLLAAPTPARAAEAQTVALSIDEAANRAADTSPLVRRARAERGATEARRVEADLILPANPGVAVSVGPTRLSAPGTGTRSELGIAGHIEQQVEIAGQRGTRQEEVARAVATARTRELLAEVETRARARAVYVAALLAEAQLEAARRREALASQLEESVRTRVSTGAASDIDLQLATLERSRIQRDRYEFVQAAGDAVAALATLLALPAGTQLRLTTQAAAPQAALPQLAEAISRAERQRADLKALDARRSELDAAVVRLKREAFPNPTVFLDVERDRPGEMWVRGGLAIPLPLARRNQGQIAVARAEQSRVDVERTVGSREVALEVDRALRAATTRGAQVALDEKEVVPAAEAALDLLTQGWRAGKFDLFRIIQASRDSAEARRRALENLGELWQARIELDRAMGTK
jgi:cobalt-zinc-cadmium efflux system outer membrane protein